MPDVASRSPIATGIVVGGVATGANVVTGLVGVLEANDVVVLGTTVVVVDGIVLVVVVGPIVVVVIFD
jgi:hypothetical protein